MTHDELRALADALPEGVHWSDPITPDMLAEAIRRFCADAQPVAWRTFDGEGNYDYRAYELNEDYADEWNRRNPNHVGWVEPLYTRPAPAAPQAEPKREDQPLRDLLAVIHCDGGHHTEAVGIEQSIKDALDAVYVLKGKLAQAEPKREPLSDEQMRAVLIAEARRIAAQAGEKDPDSLPVDEEMLAQVMLAGRAVEHAHRIGGSDE